MSGATVAPLSEVKYPSLNIAYDEAKAALTRQIDQGKQLEGKANILTAFAGLVATNLTTTHGNAVMLSIGTLLALATLALGAVVLMPSPYHAGTKPSWIRDEMLCDAEEATRLRLVDGALEMIELNVSMLNKKAFLLRLELLAFIAFVVIMMGGKILFT
jgi:hypothetical protein